MIDLFCRDEKDGMKRRRTDDEILGAIKEAYGWEVVAGVAQVFPSSRANCLTTGPWFSCTQLEASYRIEQNGNDVLEWESHPVQGSGSEVVFVWEMSLGNGALYPQPKGRFDLYINENRILSFTNAKSTRFWKGEGCELLFHVQLAKAVAHGAGFDLDAQTHGENAFAGGIAFLRVPRARLKERSKARFRVAPVNRERSRNWFRLGKHDRRSSNIVDGLDILARGRTTAEINDHLVLFGDIHTHSAEGEPVNQQGCGTGTMLEHFEYARDVSGLDLFALTDHEWQMSAQDWRHLLDLCKEFNKQGSFVTLPGLEWTSRSYGHRNLYFEQEEDAAMLSFLAAGRRSHQLGRMPTPQDVWSELERRQINAITVPHHPSTAQFPMVFDEYYSPRYDRLMEIYSCWGDSLEACQPVNAFAGRVPALAFVNRMKDNALKMGFIASSDGHDGNPGNAQGCERRAQLYHHLGSGLVAVLVSEFTRQAVFQALRERRCYAVTGERILLDFRVNGNMQGAEIDQTDTAQISVAVEGTFPLQEVAVYKNGVRAHVLPCHDRRHQFEWRDSTYQRGQPANYFVRVTQTDGEMAWSSPVWIG